MDFLGALHLFFCPSTSLDHILIPLEDSVPYFAYHSTAQDSSSCKSLNNFDDRILGTKDQLRLCKNDSPHQNLQAKCPAMPHPGGLDGLQKWHNDKPCVVFAETGGIGLHMVGQLVSL